jgi:hypothetical protein
LTKWQVEKVAISKMASWQNGMLAKWLIDRMEVKLNGKLTKRQVDKMSS